MGWVEAMVEQGGAWRSWCKGVLRLVLEAANRLLSKRMRDSQCGSWVALQCTALLWRVCPVRAGSCPVAL